MNIHVYVYLVLLFDLSFFEEFMISEQMHHPDIFYISNQKEDNF